MTVKIQPITYGKEQATSVNLIWSENQFGTLTPKIKAELISSTTNNCLDRFEIELIKSEYDLANDKEAFVLDKFGFVKDNSNPLP